MTCAASWFTWFNSQKAPSAKRCIKTGCMNVLWRRQGRLGQKAPSAKRCIKTGQTCRPCGTVRAVVRKHRAPNGALRQACCREHLACFRCVRKHRAPNGALRQACCREHLACFRCVRKHRAPNGALRRVGVGSGVGTGVGVRKHRAPNGALRRFSSLRERSALDGRSESTERQKVH